MNFSRKFLVLLSVFGSVLSQDVTFDCVFVETEADEYACILHNIEVIDPSVNVIFGGTHVENRSNADVNIVEIDNSTTPFMIPQIFTTFPNINELTIENSGLQSINIPDAVQLHWLYLFNNNISRIENGTFRNQSSLLFLYALSNNIEFIEENAFEGLSSLVSLVLTHNQIANLLPRTFQPLVNLEVMDFETNVITSISEDLFSSNTRLRLLYLDFNMINAIAPRFDAGLRNTLYLMNLSGNVCVNRSFSFANEQDWLNLEEGLATCFDNFNNGTSPETRQITMEFSGCLSIFDESNNLLTSVNC